MENKILTEKEIIQFRGRLMLECVVVESKERIKVVFVGDLEVEQELQ